MLVLSRKKNESIVINDVIVITVVEIRGDKVRLGIDAPREVAIHRSEVFAQIQAHAAAEEASLANGHANGVSEAESGVYEAPTDAHQNPSPK